VSVEQRYGVFAGNSCEHEWVEVLPPAWIDYWPPSCPECVKLPLSVLAEERGRAGSTSFLPTGPVKLVKLLADRDALIPHPHGL
jgi:hypothetical protein